MWNVMMSCANLSPEKGKLWTPDHNVESYTHQMSIFDKYINPPREYADAICNFISVNDDKLESDLTVIYKNNEPWHLKTFKPLDVYSETTGKRVKVEMIDGTVLDGGPGGRNQDVLILTVGRIWYNMRRVKFVPAFVATHEAEDLDARMRRADQHTAETHEANDLDARMRRADQHTAATHA
jgi:hypothetical protein